MKIEGILTDINKNRLPIVAILLTALLAVATAYYFWPLVEGIIFGTFFFFVTRPIKEFLGRFTKYSPYLATFCILLPFIALIFYGVFGVWDDLQWAVGHSSEFGNITKQFAASLGLPFDTNGAIDRAVSSAYDGTIAFLKGLPLRSTFSGFISLLMNALISLFVCFYLLKDGGSFIKSLRELAPIGQRHILDMFLTEAGRLLSGIYIGTFYTALFVAAGSLVIFTVFGIPYKALFTAFVFIAAMVPILSGMMVFLPLTAYIFIYRSPLIAALFLATAVIFVYLPPDFILRPYLINKASDLHPLLIILAFIGGGVAGGLSGFFAAPLVVGLLTAAYRTYKKTKGNENESIH